jgi:lipid A 3-O-deacylase
MNLVARLALLPCLAWAFPPNAHAGDRPSLTLSAGRLEVLDNPQFGELSLEYRFPEQRWGLIPTAGMTVIERGGSYVYGGLRYEIPFAERFYVAPNFAAGLYEDGDGRNLGGAVEFRSMLEVGVQLSEHSKLGLGFSHLSNANLYERNGGTEELVLRYTFDL